jgi:hypothetical protein
MVLPDFWQFLNLGWWILHLFAVAIIYLMGVSHGRKLAAKEAAEARPTERRGSPTA